MSQRIKHLLNNAIKESQLTVTQESEVDGAVKRELEYTFYGQINNLSDLGLASKKEKHEQHGIIIDKEKGFKARIRSINDEQHILTTKIKKEGVKGSLETECLISKDMFTSLKLISQDGYIKTRYYFPIKDSELIWEVDVFMNDLGEVHDWVKLDLEVPSQDTPLPKLPFDFKQIISRQSKDYTDEERQIVDRLWNKEWVSLSERK